MQTIATDVPVRQSVCLSRGYTRLRCAKTAERIEVLFMVNTLGAKGTSCQTGIPIPQGEGKRIRYRLWPLVNVCCVFYSVAQI